MVLLLLYIVRKIVSSRVINIVTDISTLVINNRDIN